MNRDLTNVIRYVMDEWIPPVVRDSRWFMYPFFWIAYRGRNIREVMQFKSRVYSFTPEDYDRFYNDLDTISHNRVTDLNKPSLEFILEDIDPSAQTLIDVGSGDGFLLRKIHERHPELQLTGFDVKDEDENGGIHDYVKGNIEKMPFPDKSFDVVTCSYTVEHLIRLEQCIAVGVPGKSRGYRHVTPSSSERRRHETPLSVGQGERPELGSSLAPRTARTRGLSSNGDRFEQTNRTRKRRAALAVAR